MKKTVLVSLLALSIAVTGPAALPAQAGAVADLLMQPGLLRAVPEGPVLRYAHDRRLPEGAAQAVGPQGRPALRPVAAGSVILSRVARQSQDRLHLALEQDGRHGEVADFSLESANPVLLFFLENVVRAVATQTGGSPFYIRNRIRDALVAAGNGGLPAKDGLTRIELRPFARDPNQTRLGAYAGLRLVVVLDPTRPDRLFELMADTGPAGNGYSESLKLVSPEE